MRQIIERLERGNLPFINEESIVEVPVPSTVISGGHKPLGSQSSSLKAVDENELSHQVSQAQQPPETFASNLKGLPS